LLVFQEAAGDYVSCFRRRYDTPEDLAAAIETWLVLEKGEKVPQGME